jgi:hypothetical protein
MKHGVKNENSQYNVYWQDLYVASIYRPKGERKTWGLAYRNGRYEHYESFEDAKDASLKIMGKTDILGAVVLY